MKYVKLGGIDYYMIIFFHKSYTYTFHVLYIKLIGFVSRAPRTLAVVRLLQNKINIKCA